MGDIALIAFLSVAAGVVILLFAVYFSRPEKVSTDGLSVQPDLSSLGDSKPDFPGRNDGRD